jgi:hypothetical protein
MYKRLMTFCAALSFWKVLGFGLVLAFVLEAITVGLRFGLGLESTRDTAVIGNMTLGLRVHHGYIGLFLLLLGMPFPRGLRNALWFMAFGLIFSDLAHHFIVLWPITGSPQFDLIYPDHPYWRKSK